MHKSVIILAIALISGGTGPAEAAWVPDVQPNARIGAAPARLHAPPLNVAYAEAPATGRGRIAACANLAAVHALNAKAVGASAPAQDRVLDLTFVLCIAGPQSED